MAEARRTHAIIVGIESYRLGEKWNIPGPAHDALDCAAWLHGCGVPARNIRLLLAPLSDKRAELVSQASDLGIAPVDIQEPTLANVEDTFDAIEGVEDGELLIVFWAGHGVINRADQRVLFTADATEKTRRNLPINERLIRLTDQAVKGFGHQIAIVDACANFVERMRWASETSPAPVIHARRRTDVRQAVLFGAMAGETAAVDRAERYGKFAHFVIGELSKHRDVLPPDMDAVARAAISYFDEQNAGKAGGQRPVYCRVRGFDQNEDEVIGELPMPIGVQDAARRASLTARQLCRLFDALEQCTQIRSARQRDALLADVLPPGADVDRSTDRAEDTDNCLRAIATNNALPAMFAWMKRKELPQSEKIAASTAERLYKRMTEANRIKARLGNFKASTPAITRAFFRVTSNPHSTTKPEGIVHALEKLLAQTDDGEASRVGRFCVHLEQFCGGGEMLPEDFFDEVGIVAATVNKIRQEHTANRARRPRLVIDLHGHDRTIDDTGWPRTIRAWLQMTDETWGPYEERNTDGTAEDVGRQFRDLVDWGWEKAQREPAIELIVPRCLMAVEFDTWEVQEALALPRPVGTRHPLVLRWGERFWMEALQRRWRSRNKQVRAALIAADPEIRWVPSSDAKKPANLQAALESDDASHCVGLEFTPDPHPTDLAVDPLVATLRAGIGYALWFRKLPNDIEPLKEQVAQLLLVCQEFDEFPEDLWRLRAHPAPAQEELARNLAVLWDDPGCLPPLNQATEP